MTCSIHIHIAGRGRRISCGDGSGVGFRGVTVRRRRVCYAPRPRARLWVGDRTRPSRRRRARERCRERSREETSRGDASHVAGKASAGGEVERGGRGTRARQTSARARRRRRDPNRGREGRSGRSGPMWARMGAKAASVRLEALAPTHPSSSGLERRAQCVKTCTTAPLSEARGVRAQRRIFN